MALVTDIEDLVLIKRELMNTDKDSFNSIDFIKKIKKDFKINCSKTNLIQIYNEMGIDDFEFKQKLIKKVQKSQSGIVSITVLTSGTPEYTDASGVRVKGTFSCLHKCSFCPDEKPSEANHWIQQPKSYLYTEPAVLRANQNDFDPIKQMNSRISSLIRMGHNVDKIELLVLGGTWSEYPKEYQEEFITSLYYTANIYHDEERREIGTLEEEIEMNETAKIHIIGLTLEMRSDSININEIKRLRRFNCTRVQLGVQHTNNEVLKMNNRGESVETTIKALRLLKNNCYKIDAHLMLNLYGSSPELDREMLLQVLDDEDLQVDQLKIYPCAVVPFTKIKELYEAGIYKPYDDKYLFEIIKEFKIKMKRYIRINRIIRDISGHYIIAGYAKDYTNLRQILNEDMKKNHWSCQCIRCREVKGNLIHPNDVHLNVIKYRGNQADEYFISYESDKYLIGFIRLRLNYDYTSVLTSLIGAALIRELHVYSNVSNVGKNEEFSLQHKGYGKALILKAEEIAKTKGFTKMAIIAGTGVRNYYRKQGYELQETYMIKELTDYH
jgi:ELP3 family radical SAM enzyme/protein acetyltransferase